MSVLTICTDATEMGQASTVFVAKQAAAAVAARGRFLLAISGGSMPAALQGLKTATPQCDFAKWHVFFADERCVPLDDEQANYKASIDGSFLDAVPADQVFAINPALAPEEAAAEYAARLTAACGEDGVLDLVLLGVGPDGHTASLFPAHALLAAPDDATVLAITDSPKPPAARITLSLPFINKCRRVAFIAGGASKAPIMSQCVVTGEDGSSVVANPASGLPCAMVKTATWFIDVAAAEGLDPAVALLAQRYTPRVIGILGALPQEIAKLKEHVQNQQDVEVHSALTVTTGTLQGRPVVFAAAGVGMVSAASVTTTFIQVFKAEVVLFMGVAGGLQDQLKVGDLVVATDVINYDMDVTNFTMPWAPDYKHKRGEFPFSGLREFPSDGRLVELAAACPCSVGVHRGRIVTGSEFVITSRKAELRPLWDELGDPLAVEMECAAVAHICHVHAVPFLGLRSISDTTSGDANVEFGDAVFCQAAADNAFCMVQAVLDGLW